MFTATMAKLYLQRFSCPPSTEVHNGRLISRTSILLHLFTFSESDYPLRMWNSKKNLGSPILTHLRAQLSSVQKKFDSGNSDPMKFKPPPPSGWDYSTARKEISEITKVSYSRHVTRQSHACMLQRARYVRMRCILRCMRQRYDAHGTLRQH